MSKSAPRLGKGLSALIGPRSTTSVHERRDGGAAIAEGPEQSASEPRLRELPVGDIRPNPKQPRVRIDENALAELAASIKQSGVLQPVLVRSTGTNAYELVAGERRWRAAKLAGLDAIPAIIHEFTDVEAFEIALIENLQREDLDPLERASAYQQLIDTAGASIDGIAERLGESRANVSNYLRLLKLSDEVQEFIRSGDLGMGQARAIAGIDSPQKQLAVARMAVRRNLSVRQVEELAKNPGETRSQTAKNPSAADHHFGDIAESFSKALGLNVTMRPGKKKNSGRVVIRYNSLEEFDRIAEKIVGRRLME